MGRLTRRRFARARGRQFMKINVLQRRLDRSEHRAQANIDKIHSCQGYYDAALNHYPGVEHVVENIEQRELRIPAATKHHDLLELFLRGWFAHAPALTNE